MNLIGSRTEQQARSELEASHAAFLRRDPSYAALSAVLAKEGIQSDDCVVTDSISEQGEDIFTVFQFPQTILIVEVPRDGSPGWIESTATLASFERSLSQLGRIRLAVAYDVVSTNRKKA